MYDLMLSSEDPVWMKAFEKNVVLSAIDSRWKDHLRSMDELRSSIGLRAYAQKDPLVEYKREAFNLFEQLLSSIDQQIINWIFRAAFTNEKSFLRFVEGARRYTLSHLTVDQLGSMTVSAGSPAQGDASPVIAVQPQKAAPPPPAPSSPAPSSPAASVPEPESAPESEAMPRPNRDPRIPFRRGDEKVGPNDPCPCGSGRKFKKCCGK